MQPSLFCYPLRNFKDAGPRGGLPAISLKISALVQSLQVNYSANILQNEICQVYLLTY